MTYVSIVQYAVSLRHLFASCPGLLPGDEEARTDDGGHRHQAPEHEAAYNCICTVYAYVCISLSLSLSLEHAHNI